MVKHQFALWEFHDNGTFETFQRKEPYKKNIPRKQKTAFFICPNSCRKMKITRLIFSLLTATLMSLMVGCNPATEKVTIKGRQILVNDTPYFIKGVCYNPVPKGYEKRDFTTLKTDLNLMVEAGINTLRVYSPIEENLSWIKLKRRGSKSS